ncbi:MAG: hypothetical protein J6V44_08340 [Methanobrevibacter sp.]|nr:hypothetical protein [Methanobrevibacter sp.]
MTYQEVAQNLINLYAHYVEVCTANEENYDDFSEEITIAVEALLIRADQERIKEMERATISHLSAVAPAPNPYVQGILDQEMAFDNHFRIGDI